MPRDTLVKVRKLWPFLQIPSGGPKDWRGARPKEQCTLIAVEDRIKSVSRLKEPTVWDWAYAILLHTRERNTKACGEWFTQILQHHKDRSTLNHGVISVPLSPKVLNVEEVLSILLYDQAPSDVGSVPQYSGGHKSSWGEWLWFQLLNDRPVGMATFDLVFAFVPTDSGFSPSSTLIQDGSSSDTQQLVEERWRPDFAVTRRFGRRTTWPGHYVLYRVDFDALERKVDATKNPYGWFGAQRVLCVPVRIQLEGDVLKWEDQFPDPSDGPWKTQGLLVWLPDDTYEVFGFDTYDMSIGGKFLVTLAPIAASESARGVIFARERGDVTSCYRIWLDRIQRLDDYEKLVAEVVRVNREMHNLGDMEQKIARLDSNDVLFRNVSYLLSSRSNAIVHYLFDPPNITLADLVNKNKVKRIQPFGAKSIRLTATLR